MVLYREHIWGPIEGSRIGILYMDPVDGCQLGILYGDLIVYGDKCISDLWKIVG